MTERRMKTLRRGSAWLLGAALLGLVMVMGGLATGWIAPRLELLLPVTQLQASSSDGSDNFVVATGIMSSEIEGVFFLDALSGDLQCTVFNPVSGGFNPPFVRNVAADLQIEAGKKPRYLMVTGHLRSARRPTKTGFAECAVYVVEANSGKFAAYTAPWQDSMFRSGRAQMGELVLLGVGSVRTAAVRE